MYLYIYIQYNYSYIICIYIYTVYTYVCWLLYIYIYVCMFVCTCAKTFLSGMRHHNPQRIIASRSCPRRGMWNLPGVRSSFETREMSTVHLFTCWENAMINGIFMRIHIIHGICMVICGTTLIKSLMLDGISIVCITLYANSGKIKIPTYRKDSLQTQAPIFTNVRKHAFPST